MGQNGPRSVGLPDRQPGDALMKNVMLSDRGKVPALGQGMWMMDKRRERRTAEMEALRRGENGSAEAVTT